MCQLHLRVPFAHGSSHRLFLVPVDFHEAVDSEIFAKSNSSILRHFVMFLADGTLQGTSLLISIRKINQAIQTECMQAWKSSGIFEFTQAK